MLEWLSHVFFRIVAIVMKVAPIGAFGAMAYTIGSFGLKTLLPLGRLMLDVYATMAIFIFVVLGLICGSTASGCWNSCVHPGRDPAGAWHVSSEAALPRMLDKMERYGCASPSSGW